MNSRPKAIHFDIFHLLIPNEFRHASSKVDYNLLLFFGCNYLDGLVTILNSLCVIEIQRFIIVKEVLRFQLVLLDINFIFHLFCVRFLIEIFLQITLFLFSNYFSYHHFENDPFFSILNRQYYNLNPA